MVILSCDGLKADDTRPGIIRAHVPDRGLWFQNAYVMHFTSPGKVWSTRPNAFNATYSHATDELKGTWTLWWRLAGELCDNMH
ncbi:hypothetical protein FOA52_013062 [Chlamydomonas sp. UWO 241]|nr:hypothetical protein FOA52_013062 [Chlamydomonas sp. UWO 241]